MLLLTMKTTKRWSDGSDDADDVDADGDDEAGLNDHGELHAVNKYHMINISIISFRS